MVIQATLYQAVHFAYDQHWRRWQVIVGDRGSLAMVSGNRYHYPGGTAGRAQAPVWYWNGEDPPKNSIAGSRPPSNISELKLTTLVIIVLDTGRVQPIIIAEEIRREVQVYVPVVKAVIEV
jgi:hypothetical protein